MKWPLKVNQTKSMSKRLTKFSACLPYEFHLNRSRNLCVVTPL